MVKRLYEELGVSEDASNSDIKRAYHRLALTCHPDKAGPAGEAQFKRISEAHGILSDPQKRALYDKHGDAGLEYVNNDMAAPMVDSLGVHLFLVLASVLLTFTLVCALTALSCIASKLDGHLASWSWASALFAVWLWWAAVMSVVVFFIFSIVHSRIADAENSRVTATHFVVAAVIVLYFIWTCLVGINLDHHKFEWFNVQIPFIIAEIGVAFGSLDSFSLKQLRQNLTMVGLVEQPPWCLYGIWVYRILSVVIRMLVAVVVGFRASGSIGGPWLLTFSPVFLFLVALLVNTAAHLRMQVINGKARPVDFVLGLSNVGVIAAMIATTVLLVGLRADGAISTSIGVCFIPVLLLLSGMVLGFCLLSCCVLPALANQQAARQAEYEANHDPGAPV